MNVAELQERKQKIYQVLGKAEASLRTGEITQEQRDAVLISYFGTPNVYPLVSDIDAQIDKIQNANESRVSKTTMLVIGFALFMVSFFAVLFYSTGGLTGAVVLEHSVNTTYFSDAHINLTLSNAAHINISGAARGIGSVRITLTENGQTHVLYLFNNGSTSAHGALPRSYYATGEPVTFAAVHLSSAYLMTNDAVLLNDTTIENLTPGNYTIKLIINDTLLSSEALPFTVTNTPITEPFNACGELCNSNITGNATVDIAITGNATVTINNILVSSEHNRPPQLDREIPDITANGTAHVDVSSAFSDPDGDQLYFDSSRHDGMTESVDNGILTATGAPGTYTYTVYASDLHELTPSNIFTITLLPETAPLDVNTTNTTVNEANQTLNETVNGTVNQTVTPIVNQTNATTNETVSPPTPLSPPSDCSEPDPNKRPLSCIQGNDSSYFRPEEIMLENKNAESVGQLTPIGNLLIKGTVVEHSTGNPRSNDYQLGYANADGDFVPTVWIDSESGDLHLIGHLTEANGNIVIDNGLSAIANRRGIVLALINRQTGDLIVRGNLIPYRRSLG